jgi:hypothetical protein
MKPERHLRLCGEGPQPGSEACPSPLSGFGSRGPSSPQNFESLSERDYKDGREALEQPITVEGANREASVTRSESDPFDDLVREWEERMDEAEKALDAVLERVRDA